jgi:hypothetical protein
MRVLKFLIIWVRRIPWRFTVAFLVLMLLYLVDPQGGRTYTDDF